MTSVVRPLTVGERAMAAAAFGPALDLGPIRLTSARFLPFQPRGVVMAPGETVWFGGPLLPDYSETGPAARGLLVHELTHCAQHQAGMSLVPRGLWAHAAAALGRRRAYAYAPTPAPLWGRPFEHQAAIVEDAYRMLHGAPPRWSRAPLPVLLAALGHAAPDRASLTASFSLGAPPLLSTPLR